MKRLLAALVAAAAACACSSAPARRAVIVDGWAPDGPGAGRRAVADALMRAVEREGGVRIDARTTVDKGAASDARVVSRTAGCVLSHEVMEEGPAAGGRAAKVRVVLSPGGAECAARPSLPPAALENAAVSVRLEGEGPFGADAARSAETALRAELAAQGVTVRASGGDYRVTGFVRASPRRDPRVHPFIGAAVELDLAVTMRDGRVVREARRRSSALDADGASAARAAAAGAAREASRDALAALDEGAWLRP